jgi:putative FmdB family regulatory protein
MPIYDFQCTKCGHKDELLRKSSASGTTTCPVCHTETFSKMLSAPSFQLNGSGWYATDFKDKKPKSAAEKTATEAAKTSPQASVDAPAGAAK